ncbi:MAG: thiol peroxidase [Phycisphaerales bacterium]
MTERAAAVTFKGNPMTLVGNELKLGQPAPAFTLIGNDMKPKSLADFKGKTIVLSTVPSLDTAVCDTQTRRFNAEAASLGDDVVVLTVSMDLPMAQKRWCGAAGVDRIVTLSDYKDHSFGVAYGLRIKELGLIARSVSVIDKQGKLAYHQLVKEVATEPDYAPALQAVKKAK